MPSAPWSLRARRPACGSSVGSSTSGPAARIASTGRAKRCSPRGWAGASSVCVGVGRHLVTAVIEMARGRFDRLHLRTENAGAARFYEALGFRPSGGASDYTHVMERASEQAPGSRAMLEA
ncbi:MAG: hypothetical protein DME15_00540 [Candidatus Rokuibacteriota bacterium]|nr:MAG: hypothetical protein DME15_00540 [Candidatus Rokubacteria bacterium]